MDTSLTVKWTISRARETYGYNVVTLRDATTRERYKANGGGYDMLGTVFGLWLADVWQDRIKSLDPELFYGLRRLSDGRMFADGGTGLEAMIRIAEASDLTVRKTIDGKGSVVGFVVTDERA